MSTLKYRFGRIKVKQILVYICITFTISTLAFYSLVGDITSIPASNRNLFYRWMLPTIKPLPDLKLHPELRKNVTIEVLEKALVIAKKQYASVLDEIELEPVDESLRNKRISDSHLNRTYKHKPPNNNVRVFADSAHPLAKLGNQIFMFASGFGIAHDLGRKFVMCTSLLWIKEIFQVTIPVRNPHPRRLQYFDTSFGIYDRQYFKADPDADLVTVTFLQSWKYFRNTEEMLRKQLVFKERFMEPARRYIARVRHKAAIEYSTTYRNVTLVGIHVRRTDMKDPGNTEIGYQVAPLSYFLKAMLYYIHKYPNVHFVIVSDDKEWCSQNLGEFFNSTSLSGEQRDSPVDLAIMSLCDHAIGSVGTYSWWGGWLAGGEVVMYDQPIRKYSSLWDDFNPKDFFKPEWTLIGR